MREKIGALIQFLSVIVAFGLLVWGVCGGYNVYYRAEGMVNAAVISVTVIHLVVAVVGLVVGAGGVILGNRLKK